MKKCNHCSKPFASKVANQAYCSDKCRNANGWISAKKRKAAKIDPNIFDWRMYKEGVI